MKIPPSWARVLLEMHIQIQIQVQTQIQIQFQKNELGHWVKETGLAIVYHVGFQAGPVSNPSVYEIGIAVCITMQVSRQCQFPWVCGLTYPHPHTIPRVVAGAR